MLIKFKQNVRLGLICAVALSACKKQSSIEEDLAIKSNVTSAAVTTTLPASPFSNYLGVNGFAWDVLQDPANPSNGMNIFKPKMHLVQSFSGFRHYLDWNVIESEQGKYTFSPTHKGGWNLDLMYQRCKAAGVDVLVCFQDCPDWLLKTYPSAQRDVQDVPITYGSDKSKPSSYLLQAKAAYQFAARYGSTGNILKSLLSIDATTRWTGDQANVAVTGLGTVKYMECNNEPDRWWKGDKANQTAEQYAANMSAFYDGHKGTLGKGVGVKTADPNMIVVMGGLASADPAYVQAIINWCKTNRGYRSDGSINLCFDIINYHLYPNDHSLQSSGNATQGIAPELSEAASKATSFAALGKTYGLPVWVTESGYDVNDYSIQRSIAIGNKSNLVTQADWQLRTSLLYARSGIQKLFFYELFDDNLYSSTAYESSGMVTSALTRRPSANYMMQAKLLLGSYTYQSTISQDPFVDVYKNGSKTIYSLVSPHQSGKSVSYTLKLPSVKQVIIHNLNTADITTIDTKKTISSNSLTLSVTETPMFVEVVN